jgi:hypothetical protein
MNQPSYYENGIPVYSKWQIDLFGPPDKINYLVLDDDVTYLPSYTQIQHCLENLEYVHHYDRVQRFTTILLQIVGDARISSKKGMKCMKKVSRNIPSDIDLYPLPIIYQIIRNVMRHNGLKIYYNRVATVLNEFNITDTRKHYSPELINNVIEDFKKMHFMFEKIKKDLKRTYFPNLKYVALKLLLKYGFTNPFNLKLAKTPARLLKLNKDYDLIWNIIEEEELIDYLTSVFD